MTPSAIGNSKYWWSSDRRTAETTRLQLTFAEPQELRQVEALGDFVQRLLLDEVGAQTRQVSLVDFVVTVEKE